MFRAGFWQAAVLEKTTPIRRTAVRETGQLSLYSRVIEDTP